MTDVSRANKWDTKAAKELAKEIASIPGLYCGPAVVGWVAAVWKQSRGKTYDLKRLKDKKLFPDGPRDFTGKGSVPGFQSSLRSILKRETHDELTFASDVHRKYGTLHDELEEHDFPIVIRMTGKKFTNGLHYVTLYKSEKRDKRWAVDRIKFYWQDNGFYGESNGLYASEWRDVGHNAFFWGAKRVMQSFASIIKDATKNN